MRGAVVLAFLVGCGSVQGTPDDAPIYDGAPDSAEGDLDSSGLAVLSIVPTEQDFGSVPTGVTSSAADFVVTNSGTGGSASLVTMVSGPPFAISSDGCAGVSLAPNETCTVSVTFAPTEEIESYGGLDVNEPGAGPVSASLHGVGISADGLYLNPSFYSFGTVILGTSAPSTTFTLTNNGSVTTGTIAASISGTSASEFAVTSDCTTLDAAASCTVTVTLNAAGEGLKDAMLDVSASPGGSFAAPLGAMVISPAVLQLQAASTTDYGDVIQGNSADLTFVVSNSGSQVTGPVTVSVSGADYTILSGVVGDCASGVTTLALDQTCNVRVRFTPSTTGARPATLSASASPGGSPTLTLSGNGITPGTLTSADSSHAFGNVEVGVGSGSFTWTITNSGAATTGVPSLASSNPTEVAVTNNCTAALAPAASCTIGVTFTPSAGGARSGNLTVTASPGGTLALAVTANAQWRLTVTKSGTGTVATTAGSAINCGSTCTALFDHNSSVTIRANTTNGSNSYFSAWSGACSSAGSYQYCTMTMNGVKTTTATFSSSSSTNLAFISSATYPANLGSAAAYDTACNTLATSAGINNSAGTAFKAWLSSTSSAATRVGTTPAGSATGGWRRLDGQIVARSYAELINKKILMPMIVTELGEKYASSYGATTATNDNGTVRASTCSNWTTTTGSYDGGTAGGGPGHWTVWSVQSCATSYRLYCFENTKTTTLSPPSIPAGGKRIWYVLGYSVSMGSPDTYCQNHRPSGVTTAKSFGATTARAAASTVVAATDYYRPDGMFVGTGQDLINGGVLNSGIWETHDLLYNGGSIRAFTGATSPSSVGTNATTCTNWTNTTHVAEARSGYVNRALSSWFSSNSDYCDNTNVALYCVEQ